MEDFSERDEGLEDNWNMEGNTAVGGWNSRSPVRSFSDDFHIKDFPDVSGTNSSSKHHCKVIYGN